LHWHQPPVCRASVVAAASADQALDDLAAHLGDAFEAITAYAEFASLLATTSDFDEVLGQVRRKLAQTIEHEALVLRFLQGDSLVLAAPAGRFPHSIPLASPGYEARVAAARNCAALASPADLAAGDPLAAASGPLVIVAIGCPKRSRGTLTLVRSAGAPAFTAGQIAFVQSVADFLGAAQSLAESRQQREEQIRLEQELQLAARIQHQLLPQSPPSVAGWTVAGACQPSRAMGGDYFDWIVRDDGSCLVLVADVMGKGMPAAMVATMLRSTWRTIARRGVDPGQLFTELNTHLVRDLATLEVFITAVLVHVTPGSGRVRYANAGHCALLQCSGPDADCRPHACGGPPLGINAETRFAPAELVLAPGDSLFAFTDGCYELDRRSGSAAGLRLLEGELRTSSGLAPVDLVPALLRKLQARVAGELPDDCTLVAMRFNR
jgi:serine phosphatase RsbU (regulator of sigma subunit)